jgi:hypothetical protein
MHNLTVACFDCNRGKAAVPLSSLPETIESQAELMRERRAQVLAFERMARLERRRIERTIDDVEGTLLAGTDHAFTDKFRASVRMFLEKLPPSVVMQAAEKSADRWPGPALRIKYFCGICWRTIKGDSPSANWSKYHAEKRYARA